MASSREFLETLSHFCYVSKTPYLFNKESLSHDRYQKGVVQVYEWVDELCFYYLRRENQLLTELHALLHQRYAEIRKMPSSSYRDGLLKGLDEILDYVKKLEKKP